MANTTNNSELLIALIAGATVGAAVAVLYAPRSGKETRSQIRRGAVRASENLANAATTLSKNAKNNFEEGGDNLGHVIGSAIARTVLSVEEIIKIVKMKLIELKLGEEAFDVEKKILTLPDSTGEKSS